VLTRRLSLVFILILLSLALAACQPGAATTAPAGTGSAPALRVLAAETFLADIAQNVAGSRLKVEALMPFGVDPHAYEPTPQDVVKIADSDLLITNGAGLEGWLTKLLTTNATKAVIIEASAGLKPRTPGAGEAVINEVDPHFWLDPTNVITYVNNIRNALITADPAGSAVYTTNAAAYILSLQELDTWVAGQVAVLPPERRLLVTNHETFGYFADRYGFTIIGTIIPSVSSDASPSAQQLAQLVNSIVATKAPAVFLENGTNPQLANQLAQETGIKVVTGLYTHSITEPSGQAPTYIDMIKYDVQAIVAALR
jgi:ABC-type Zn uptake system ZnuABC Zn-binding protein ZnuA